MLNQIKINIMIYSYVGKKRGNKKCLDCINIRHARKNKIIHSFCTVNTSINIKEMELDWQKRTKLNLLWCKNFETKLEI